jgi:hypothetical protein
VAGSASLGLGSRRIAAPIFTACLAAIGAVEPRWKTATPIVNAFFFDADVDRTHLAGQDRE